MSGKYILDNNGEPVACSDVVAWAKWFETAKDARIVKKTEHDGVEVSTVFLSLDHGFGVGAPLLFETMIFGGEHDGYQDRYSTRQEAISGHEQAVALAFGGSK